MHAEKNKETDRRVFADRREYASGDHYPERRTSPRRQDDDGACQHPPWSAVERLKRTKRFLMQSAGEK